MRLLYDEIKSRGWLMPLSDEKYRHSLQSMIDRAVVWNIDNVAEYLQGLDKPGISVANIQEVTPPFETMFLEYQALKEDTVDRVGVLVWTLDLYKWITGLHGELSFSSPEARDHAILKETKDMEIFEGIELLEAPRWILELHVFSRSGKMQPIGTSMESVIILNSDGAQIRSPLTGKPIVSTRYIDGENDDTRVPYSHLRLAPVAFALSLSHCKNVSTMENEGRFENRQQRRLAERQNLPKPTRFYTLAIDPNIGKSKTTSGSSGSAEKHVSLHICRGHFSEYSEEKPLFGKYAGRFWIPAHVRGSSEVGIVGKDYSVNAPKEDVAA